ncbi:MAG: radical SAM protein [Candidatus Omnitrophota bacterium]|nr:radical SAM protein [Candidatus Omnitrophota bacterium]
MANVCLIYPRDINLNFFPLGLGYVASSLMKNNHDVIFLDITEKDLGLLNRIRDRKPDIVGISVTTPQLKLAKTVIGLIKNLMPGVPIVAGGIHPSYFKSKFMDELGVDYIIYGEGEVTMCELCDCLRHGSSDLSKIHGLIFRGRDGGITVNPPRKLIEDLDTLAFPARELVNYETYLQPPGLIRGVWTRRCANITTSRGCPGRCTYCGVNYLWGNTYRRRSVDNVLEEIDLIASKYNVDGLYFMDDTFLMGSKWVEEFSEKFITKKYDIKWACYSRADTVNERMLKAIRRAGCVQVEYGIESCSERVLNKIKKRTNFKQVSESVKMTRAIGMRALGSFIFGFPDDSAGDLKETISSSSKMDLDFVTCYFATPYPGSELYEQAVKENRILERDMSNWYVRNNNIWKVSLDQKILSDYRNTFLRANRYKNILFFLKNPGFLIKLALFVINNYKALFKSVVRTVKGKCFDDFGYYFYTYLSADPNSRNRL